MEDKLIDQSELAQSVAEKISYEFTDQFLIKPLDPVKVKKEFTKPVSTKQPVTDDNGIEAVDYEEVETEVKEVDSDFSLGVILKLPRSYQQQLLDPKYDHLVQYKVGDVVVYPSRSKVYFDLVKDTQLLRYYDIIGVKS